VPPEWNAFCYVHNGSGTISGKGVAREQAVVLGPGSFFTAEG
jgi:redox-sensitive bicupin YhaK (pirin superfamily)